MPANKLTLDFERVVHDALYQEHPRRAGDIQPSILAFAMQEEHTDGRVGSELLRGILSASVLVNPQARDA